MAAERSVAMKPGSYARMLFGASAVLFGVICLMWHDPDTWQSLSSIWKLPLGTAIGALLMIAQIAGGIMLAYPGSARRGSTVLVVVYALFSLACIPGIVAAPRVFGQYDGFFEQFCLLSGALAAFARTAARLGLGVSTVSFTVAQIVYLLFTASLVPTWIPPNQMFWAIFTTVTFALAALAILTNLRARLAARLMTLMVVLFGVLVWIPRLVAHPSAHGDWSEFALTLLIAGASWTVAESAL